MFYFKPQVWHFKMALIFRLDNHPQKTSRSFEFNFHRLFAAMYLESRNLKILFLQLFPSYFCRNRPSTCSFLLMPLDVAATTTRSKFFSTTSNSPPLYYMQSILDVFNHALGGKLDCKQISPNRPMLDMM